MPASRSSAVASGKISADANSSYPGLRLRVCSRKSANLIFNVSVLPRNPARSRRPFSFGGEFIQFVRHRVERGQVVREGGFASDRFADAARFHRSQVDAVGEFVIKASCFSEPLGQKIRRALSQRSAVVDSHFVHLACRDAADPPERFDRQARDESGGAVGMDRAESVRFPVVRSDLGEKFIVGYSGRCDQSQFVADLSFDGPGDVRR